MIYDLLNLNNQDMETKKNYARRKFRLLVVGTIINGNKRFDQIKRRFLMKNIQMQATESKA